MRFKKINPSRFTNKYRLYSPTSLKSALNAVKVEGKPVYFAARQYNVPLTTLRDRVDGRVQESTLKSGPSPVLCRDEEPELVEHIKFMASVGYGYTRQQVITLASDYATSLKKREELSRFSKRWLENFLTRWPELKVLKPRGLSIERARCGSPDIVDRYFLELGAILEKHNLMEKPQCIYNIDEKGITTEHKPPFIVALKNTPAQAITSARSNITTVICGGNALGMRIPPFFVFKGKRCSQTLLEGAIPGVGYSMSDSGWSNSSIFSEYLKNHFMKYIVGRKESPILVLYDGHVSHISIPLIEWARENNIILFVLPPHTSHILQPMDVGCFGPFSTAYNKECHVFMQKNPGKSICRYNVCELACRAHENALTPSNVRAAFKESGIYPYNPNAIKKYKITPSAVFKNQNSNVDPLPSSQIVGSQFLQKKKVEILGQITTSKENKQRKSISKVVAGKAITEDPVVANIKNYFQEKQLQPSTFVSKTAEKPGPSKMAINSDEEDEREEDLCCVCKQWSPPNMNNEEIHFVKWAQCDQCNHWTHLQYCTNIRFVRRLGKFNCPHCNPSSEE